MNPFELPLFDPAIVASPQECERLAGFAAKGQWDQYAKAALPLGTMTPFWGESSGWEAAPDALLYGLNANPNRVEDLRRLVDMAPASSRQNMLDACLGGIVGASSSLFVLEARQLAKSLVQWGANPRAQAWGDPAARCAATGALRLLKGMLDGGMDPSQGPPGKLPLIVLALHKDRSHSLAEKMSCAETLSCAGAKVLDGFVDSSPQSPRSLLEVALEQLRARPLAPTASALDPSFGWMNFEFPWNYYEDAGLAIEQLLPARADSEGLERIERLMESAAMGGWEVSVEAQRSCLPWLSSALDTAQLWLQARAQGVAPPKISPKSL